MRYFIKDIKYLLYKIKNFISNFWYYKNYLWYNLDTEPYYTYHLFYLKLKRINRYIDSKSLKHAIILIDKLNEDVYHERLFKDFEEKYGELDIVFVKNRKEKTSTIKFIYKDKNYTKQEIEEIDKKRKKLYKKIDRKNKFASKLLFKIIEMDGNKWWD